MKNTVVNGKVDQEEKVVLKDIIDKIKAKEFVVDPLNKEIISLIRSGKEDYYYDFKILRDNFTKRMKICFMI